jgi:hypothetical protein
MTLVLSVSTPAYALHVSDRLVSKAGRPHDPFANKTVVVRATDGLLAFGYTGPAFIEGVPTDSWIAEIVSGAISAGEPAAVRYGSFPVRDVGRTLLRLCERFRAERLFQRLGGQIVATGWQWDGRRERAHVRNVLWVLDDASGKLRWRQLVPRHGLERTSSFRMVATGNWALSSERWQATLDEVGRAGHDWNRVERRLIDAIRGSSRLEPGTIGPHCMSVLLRPWRVVTAELRFTPDAPHEAEAFGQTVETAYSPWMVAPDAIHAPSVLVGGWRCEQGLLPYSSDAPPVPDSQMLKGAFQSQDRPSA